MQLNWKLVLKKISWKIIVCGRFFSMFVMVPVVLLLGQGASLPKPSGRQEYKKMRVQLDWGNRETDLLEMVKEYEIKQHKKNEG